MTADRRLVRLGYAGLECTAGCEYVYWVWTSSWSLPCLGNGGRRRDGVPGRIVDGDQVMSLTRPDVLGDPRRYESVARRIFEIAIAEGRSAELLLSLFAGAGCTIGATGELRVWWPTAGKEEGEGA